MDDIIQEMRERNFMYCYQCATCTGSCPVSKVDSRYNPRVMIEKALLGRKEEIIGSEALWWCTTCYTCQERCPQDVKVTEVIMALQNEAARLGNAPEKFLGGAEMLYKYALTAHIVGFVEKQRERLGLKKPPKISLEAAKKIIEETGLLELMKKEGEG